MSALSRELLGTIALAVLATRGGEDLATDEEQLRALAVVEAMTPLERQAWLGYHQGGVPICEREADAA